MKPSSRASIAVCATFLPRRDRLDQLAPRPSSARRTSAGVSRLEQLLAVLVLEVVDDVDEEERVTSLAAAGASAAHLLGGGSGAIVHGLAAILDTRLVRGHADLVDRRLRRGRLLMLLLDDRARFVELPAQLLGARIRLGNGRRRTAELAVERHPGARRTGQPGGPGLHVADATLAAFLPRLAPFAPELRWPARPPQTEGREGSGA